MSNEVLNTIKARRAVRAYKPDGAPAEAAKRKDNYIVRV